MSKQEDIAILERSVQIIEQKRLDTMAKIKELQSDVSIMESLLMKYEKQIMQIKNTMGRN